MVLLLYSIVLVSMFYLLLLYYNKVFFDVLAVSKKAMNFPILILKQYKIPQHWTESKVKNPLYLTPLRPWRLDIIDL